jgi:hypothetical protein
MRQVTRQNMYAMEGNKGIERNDSYNEITEY